MQSSYKKTGDFIYTSAEEGKTSFLQSHPLAILDLFQRIKHRFPASEVFDALLNAVGVREV